MSHFQPMARAVSRWAQGSWWPPVRARRQAKSGRLGTASYRLISDALVSDPSVVVRSVLALRKILADQRPDIIHAIALPPVVVTALATAIGPERLPIILAPTGLGHLWIENDWASTIAREAVRRFVSLSAKRQSTHFCSRTPRTLSNSASIRTTTLKSRSSAAPASLRPRSSRRPSPHRRRCALRSSRE